MLNDFQPPLSSKFLILHLLVYLFNVSWINQEENLAEKQEFYLYHFITFASSPTPVFTFSAKNRGIAFFFFYLEDNCFTLLLVSAVHQCESAISIHLSLSL